MILLPVSALAGLVSGYVSLRRSNLIDDVLVGRPIDTATADAADNVVALAGTVDTLLYALAMALLMLWIFRAAKNAAFLRPYGTPTLVAMTNRRLLVGWATIAGMSAAVSTAMWDAAPSQMVTRDDVAQLANADRFDLVPQTGFAIAAVIAVFMVRRFTARQDAVFADLIAFSRSNDAGVRVG